MPYHARTAMSGKTSIYDQQPMQGNGCVNVVLFGALVAGAVIAYNVWTPDVESYGHNVRSKLPAAMATAGLDPYKDVRIYKEDQTLEFVTTRQGYPEACSAHIVLVQLAQVIELDNLSCQPKSEVTQP